MSSEYSIHLGDKPVKGEVVSLNPELSSTVVRVKVDNSNHKFVLYVKDGRLLEMSLLFHKIAQDLAALLPDVDVCCRCEPGTPDDQCAEHGFEAFKIEQAKEGAEHDDCPHSEMGFTTPCNNSCPCYQAGYEAERRPLGC